MKTPSSRNLSMPELPITYNISQAQLRLKENLDFLNEKGFISPKYFSKRKTPGKTKQTVRKLAKIKIKNSFSDNVQYQEDLKSNFNHYNAYREMIKPSLKDLNYLCPFDMIKVPLSLCSPTPSYVPKAIHSNYLRDSMQSLKNTDFRIKKAKEYIKVARRLSKKYS